MMPSAKSCRVKGAVLWRETQDVPQSNGVDSELVLGPIALLDLCKVAG